MQSATLRVWSPPQSPVRIEYAAGLLRQADLESAHGDVYGILFGFRDGDRVRVLAARRHADPADPRLAGLDQVGSFAARARGEVFLTESDLKRFESLDPAGAIALVIAGNRAGFFIRQADGSMQTIRSYEEFAVNGPAANVKDANVKDVEPPKFVTLASRTRRWDLITLGCLSLIAIPLMVYAYLPPLFPPGPLGLAIHEELGQLRIQWNPLGETQHASVEILDGAERTVIPVSAMLSSATYVFRNSDVEVSLRVLEKGFAPRQDVARFFSADLEHTRAEIQSLESQAARLNSEVRDGRQVLAALQKKIAAYKLP